MNVSLRWLRQIAPQLDGSAHELSERLAELGFPVESVHEIGALLSDIVVARIVEARPHPNADRLRLCSVDAGTGELLSVVCGAPNARADATFPFIPVGGTLPGGMSIRKAKIRGERSFGMLCSARELGLGTDHDGLLELRTDAAPGTPFIEAYGLAGDVMLDVEVTSNRPDMLSHIGVARELVPDTAHELQLPAFPDARALPGITWVSAEDEVEITGLRVGIDDANRCHRFTGAIVRGVQVAPSPDWLQARLRAIGARPINNVVDATNYVLFELGQPTHAYDLDRLGGGRIAARPARSGEALTTLDGVERTLSDDMLVIADGERAVNVAGIMGDERTGVHLQTSNVFIECALFEPASVRRTKKALAIQSDAGYRFERGVDPTLQRAALQRVVELILTVAGGEVEPNWADVHPRAWESEPITLRLSRVEHLLGAPFARDEVSSLLAPLGFESAQAGSGAPEADALEVRTPGWRAYDVTREVDLIEEVARRYGYERFPEDERAWRPNTVPDHPLFQLEDDLRRLLTGRGFFEAQTPAFVPEAEGDLRLLNPLSTEEPVLRRTLLPSLIRRLERNLARGVRDVRLFELGTSFRGDADREAEREAAHLSLVFTGRRAPLHWTGAAEPFDIWDLKGVLEAVVEFVHPTACIEPGALDYATDHDPLNAQRAFTVRLAEGQVVGHAGLIEAHALDVPAWAGEVFGLELTLPSHPAPGTDPGYVPLPAHPGVERDVALLVADAVPAERIAAVARAAGGALLQSVVPFDVYTGEGLPAATRSMAWRFSFRATDRTLTDAEVEAVMKAIVTELDEQLDVRPRS